jgi:FkbM family methyltransferase
VVYDMTDLTGRPATREDIVAAYHLFLLREPDEVGLEHYSNAAAQGRLAIEDVLPSFTSSTEYVNRNLTDLRRASAVVDVQMSGYSVFVERDEPEFARHIVQHKSWEPHLRAVIEEHLRPGDIFVDVGANVGVMAFAAAKRVGPAGAVIAFEPNKYNARMLLKGIAKNGFGGFVRLYPFALSEKQGLFSMEGFSNTYLVSAGSSERLVQSMRGDDILSGEPRIDFIKLDIEGHEPFALTGMKDVLRTRRPTLLCEFNPRCLKDHIGRPHEVFAEQLFELTNSIDAIEHSGRRNTVTSPRELVELWNMRNRQAVDAKLLPEGMLHFDLLFKVV